MPSVSWPSANMFTKPVADATMGVQEPELAKDPERSMTRTIFVSRRWACAVTVTVIDAGADGRIRKKYVGTVAVTVVVDDRAVGRGDRAYIAASVPVRVSG